ncbi:MAG: glycosyltransferase family 4 protein [Ignavibacteria bacterium]|nr:glycosyltransferase family 4 protein [Ignavibacteria bacterium]
MKILIVANIRKQQGGITTQVLELCDSLRSEGLEVELASTHGSIRARISGFADAYRKGKNSDLILGVGCAYYGVFPMLAASIISGLLKKRVLYNFHDGQVYEFINKYNGFLKLFFRKNIIIVATDYLLNAFLKYGFNARIIENHLNENVVRVKQNESENGILKFMWARSYERLYRADIMLEAAAEILKRYNVEFHMYGGGSLRDYYTKMYNREGIIFHEFMKREKLLEEYGKYDVFVNTSDYDNFPMSIVEAGMNGLLVLTSRAGGINSIYTDNEVLFFEKGNTGDLIEKLRLLINGIEKYSHLITNLQNKTAAFNWGNVKNKWLSLINENIISDVV